MSNVALQNSMWPDTVGNMVSKVLDLQNMSVVCRLRCLQSLARALGILDSGILGFFISYRIFISNRILDFGFQISDRISDFGFQI